MLYLCEPPVKGPGAETASAQRRANSLLFEGDESHSLARVSANDWAAHEKGIRIAMTIRLAGLMQHSKQPSSFNYVMGHRKCAGGMVRPDDLGTL